MSVEKKRNVALAGKRKMKQREDEDERKNGIVK